MENLNDHVSSSGIVPLFIQEEDEEPSEAVSENSLERSPAQSDHTFIGAHLETMSIGPYLREMDDLLKSCEKFTGITTSIWSKPYENKDDITMKKYSETKVCSQEYMSTSCIDTHVDMTEDNSRQTQLQDSVFDSFGARPNVSSSMPLTSAGNKLSKSMAEYEGRLQDMLAMLESCVEDSAMDFEPQDWTPKEEYIHIPKLFKETAKTPLEPGTAMIVEAQAAAMNFCDHQDNIGNEVHVRKTATRALTQNVFDCDSVNGLSVKSPEKCSKTDPEIEWTENKQMMCEETCTKEEYKTDMAFNNSDQLTEARVDMTGLRCGVTDLETLGFKLDKCIDEVQGLEQRRKELLADVIELSGHGHQEEPTETNEQEQGMDQMDSKVAELIRTLRKEEHLRREKSKSEIESLKQERAEEERKLWRVNVERQGMKNDLWKLKRKLFVIAKESAQSQAALSAQHRLVELLKKEQEKLQTVEVQLREDSNKLQMGHQQELVGLQEQLNAATSSHLSNTQEELTHCRRDSCGNIQKHLQDSLQALEQRYGPILMALLKRRDTAVDTCAKVKEQSQKLRVQLAPLRDEIQKLILQKACLEEKLKLIHFQRKEEVGQYKETVNFLEESCRELKMELKIQKKKTKKMEELKESLSKQLMGYRSAVENQVMCDKETA